MSGNEFLSRCRARGFHLKLDSDKNLLVVAPHALAMTSKLRQFIQQHKGELVGLLDHEQEALKFNAAIVDCDLCRLGAEIDREIRDHLENEKRFAAAEAITGDLPHLSENAEMVATRIDNNEIYGPFLSLRLRPEVTVIDPARWLTLAMPRLENAATRLAYVAFQYSSRHWQQGKALQTYLDILADVEKVARHLSSSN